MALSKIWTVDKFHKHAAGDMGVLNELHYVQRFEKVNMIQYAVATEFYPLMASAYRTPTLIVVDNTGIYGNGTWTAATSRLTLGVRNTDFLSTDVGKLIVFRAGTSFYVGTIDLYISPSIVKLTGTNLRATDCTVDEAMMIATSPSGDYVELATLAPAMMRIGQQVDIEVHSTNTTSVHPSTPEEIRTFQAASPLNRNKILFALEGSKLLLAKGSGLAAYGALTLKYPRVPVEVVRGADYLDLPDGAPITLAMTLYRRMVGPPELGPTLVQDAARNVKAIYDSFQVKASLEEIEEKVKNLS